LEHNKFKVALIAGIIWGSFFNTQTSNVGKFSLKPSLN
jgi:hypothetical protein